MRLREPVQPGQRRLRLVPESARANSAMVKWSWKIGRLFGIAVYVHATFLMLLVWIGAVSWKDGGSVLAIADGIGFILALFGCIVLHELGHALTARHYGIQTRDITLLPIGGLARLERMPEKPRQELAVALAGPAVNVAIALLLLGVIAVDGSAPPDPPLPGDSLAAMDIPFLQRLMAVNLFIAVFNLLPAFPMDGGRALRAFLASRRGYVSATQLAASVGQAMAFVFGLIGLLYNPFLLFIALFVWIGAATEASSVQMRAAIAGIPVAHAMLGDFRTLARGDTLGRAVELTLRGSQKDFPVTENGHLVGMLSQERLIEGLTRVGTDGLVGPLAEREAVSVDSHEMLEGAMARLSEGRWRTVPVMHGDALVGLLTLDNVGELVQIQAALDVGRGSGLRDRDQSAPGIGTLR